MPRRAHTREAPPSLPICARTLHAKHLTCRFVHLCSYSRVFDRYRIFPLKREVFENFWTNDRSVLSHISLAGWNRTFSSRVHARTRGCIIFAVSDSDPAATAASKTFSTSSLRGTIEFSIDERPGHLAPGSCPRSHTFSYDTRLLVSLRKDNS